MEDRNLSTQPSNIKGDTNPTTDCRSVLQQLAAEAKNEIRLGDEAAATMKQAGVTALHHYMAAGDAIEKALQRTSGNKKVWLEENGFVARTAFLYVQLARQREKIEAEISRLGTGLSLRAARKLISTSKKSNKKSDGGSESSTSNKSEAEDSDRGQALQHDDADHGHHGVDGNGHTEKSTEEERRIMRDLVLEEYFVQATGFDIFDYILDCIPKARHAEVHAEYLDRLTVKGMLEAASHEFKRQLCKQLPGKSKKFKTMDAVQTGRDASEKPIFTPQGRGGHSRFN